MGNRSNPPTLSLEEIKRTIENNEEHASELKFLSVCEKADYLFKSGKISLFAYYAEILTFIAEVSRRDPQWIVEFSYINQNNPRDQPCVTIPVAMLGALAEGWGKYRDATENLSLGRACAVEARGKATGQGIKNDRDAFDQLEGDEHLAMQVISLRAALAQKDQFISLDDAFEIVAGYYLSDEYEAERKDAGIARSNQSNRILVGSKSVSVGPKRIRAAYEKHSIRLLKRLETAGAKFTPQTS